MNPEQSITLFSTGFYIFLGIMVIGFGLAVFFFFFYKIPAVYALMTGRAQKKTIEKMQKSGQLRSQEEIEAERESYMKNSATGGLTGDFATEAIGKAQPTVDQGSSSGYGDSMATTVLAAATETTVLEPEMATTVLEEDPETSVLGQTVLGTGYEMGITAPLNPGMQNAEYVYGNAQPETMPEAEPQYFFESIEHVMVVHTNEII